MTPHVADIQYAVCERFHVSYIDLISQRLGRDIARPRQVAMYLARELTPLSLPAIGRIFNRDHSTVIHACRKVEQVMQEDRAFAAIVERLRWRIVSGGQTVLPFEA